MHIFRYHGHGFAILYKGGYQVRSLWEGTTLEKIDVGHRNRTRNDIALFLWGMYPARQKKRISRADATTEYLCTWVCSGGVGWRNPWSFRSPGRKNCRRECRYFLRRRKHSTRRFCQSWRIRRRTCQCKQLILSETFHETYSDHRTPGLANES